MSEMKVLYRKAYRIARELSRACMSEYFDAAMMDEGIPGRVARAAWQSLVNASAGDEYAFGAWRAKHDPNWLPF